MERLVKQIFRFKMHCMEIVNGKAPLTKLRIEETGGNACTLEIKKVSGKLAWCPVGGCARRNADIGTGTRLALVKSMLWGLYL